MNKNKLLNDIEIFLAEKEISKSTNQNYRRYLRLFIDWMESKNLDFDSVTVRDVKDWIHNDLKFNNANAYTCSVVIRGFAMWSFGQNHQLSRLRIRREDPGLQRTLTLEQVNLLFSSFPNPYEINDKFTADKIRRDKAIIALALDTGLRASELARLDLMRLDLDNKILSVFSKGYKWRTCVFSEQTRELLLSWLEVRHNHAKKGVNTVFVAVGGKKPGLPLSKSSMRYIALSSGKRAGLLVSIHDLRRTFATISIQQGAPTRLVQVQGGWSDIKLVERYSRALKSEDYKGYFPINNIDVGLLDPGKTKLLQEGKITDRDFYKAIGKAMENPGKKVYIRELENVVG